MYLLLTGDYIYQVFDICSLLLLIFLLHRVLVRPRAMAFSSCRDVHARLVQRLTGKDQLDAHLHIGYELIEDGNKGATSVHNEVWNKGATSDHNEARSLGLRATVRTNKSAPPLQALRMIMNSAPTH